LISFYRPEDIGTAAEVCQSFCIDNGAFSAWKQNKSIDWSAYYDFVANWCRHPGFDWAIIPDVIDGTESDNDKLIEQWPSDLVGIPVWHMHESIFRLESLCHAFTRVALGSSGEFATVGSDGWWRRMSEVMMFCCDNAGRPTAKLHGLRMLDPAVFTKLPLASADSTNAVRNSSSYSRFGMYTPPNASTRMSIIAERIEAHQSAAIWTLAPADDDLMLF
tara:strand:+ start:1162 stop:1818 length:657 start_codon:yes stop_codon:yes gene_type:complete